MLWGLFLHWNCTLTALPTLLFIMSETISNTDQELTTSEFTREIACWLESFNGCFTFEPKTQQLLFDSILCLDEQLFSDKEKEVVREHLNAALKLSFIVKDNQENLTKFIKYHV